MYESIEKFKSIIKDSKVVLLESEPTSYRFKAEIQFIDNSILLIKEYIIQNKRKYSYHWQINNNLLIRWDNAPHWKKISTFPYHKHIEKKSNVVSSTEVCLDEILGVIKKEITGK